MSLLAPPQEAFLTSVMSLQPRLAVFDCDGTLWAGDSGQDFFYWELDRGLVPAAVARWVRTRYTDYLAGRVGEEVMCGEMVQIHRGLEETVVAQAAREFFADAVAARIFPEMRELTRRLAAAGAEIWAVSSTNHWVVAAGVERFGIPRARVLAASVAIASGRITDRLLRVPSGEGKALAIREQVGRPVDVAFGNSIHDAAMLESARHAFAISPKPDLEEVARSRGWTIYCPPAAATPEAE